MRNRFKLLAITMIATAVTTVSMGTTAYADDLSGGAGWKVEFNADKQMVSNFTTNSLQDTLSNMQPGDSATFRVEITSTYGTDTDWYMSNDVIKSLEDGSKTAKGGAYTYELTYTDPNDDETILYTSETVGGEDNKAAAGLNEATDALDEFFYLDTLETGESGSVQLYVELDGETQDNSYQDTLAQLQLNFAVELPTVTEDHTTIYHEYEKVIDKYITKTDEDTYITDEGTPTSLITLITDEDTPKSNGVRTGDETQLLLLVVIASVLGILLLLLAIYGVRLRRRMNKANHTTGMLLLVGLLTVAALCPMNAQAADDNTSGTTATSDGSYQYTVTIYSGEQSSFERGNVATVSAGLNETIDLTTYIAQADENLPETSKYYVMGIRESGKDSSECIENPESYTVTQDIDLVIAYGMRAKDVQYTVNYLEKDTGKVLHAAQTFYGNVGDEMVVAFEYIDGYVPNAFSERKTLDDDSTKNVFTFYYTYDPDSSYTYYVTDEGVKYVERDGKVIFTYVPGGVTYLGNTVNEGGVTDNGVVYVSGSSASGTEDTGNVVIYGEESGGSGSAGSSADSDAAASESDSTGPAVLVDLDDEETPLADGGSASSALASVFEGTNALLLTAIVAAIALIVLLVALLVLVHSRRKDKVTVTG